jgi:hypothetical protein
VRFLVELGARGARAYSEIMRGFISILSVLALAACGAAAPHPLVASYDVDAHTIVPIVYDATHAAHYRVAVVDPHGNHARFVMVPDGGGEPLVVRIAAQSYAINRFATCVGACSTQVAVTGNDAHARELFDAIGTRAQAARLDH